ncbi:MAG: hypothetical protein HBSIN02_16870 [Bacteroidia bacterium]|nr:MAG: hypothetical protein HBSIN02_16870 [Bacteroidia bacterium]
MNERRNDAVGKAGTADGGRRFLAWVAVWYALLTTAGYLVAVNLEGDHHVDSVLAGAIISLSNFLLGFASVEYAFDKSHTTFLKVVLGGMVGRLMLMALVVLALIKLYAFDALSLMLTLLGYYIVNLALEIVFLQKKVSLKNTVPTT